VIRRLAPTAALLAVLVLVTTAGAWSRPVLGALSLARHQERYTSIAFVEALTPLFSAAAGSGLTLTARVVNHQGAGTRYTLDASLVDKSGAAMAAPRSQSFALPDGGTLDVPITFTLPGCTGRIRVDVDLAGRTEALHAWLNVQSTDPKVHTCA
jgi:hypothetical protein